jgi:lysyl-tRNA synthetase class 2
MGVCAVGGLGLVSAASAPARIHLQPVINLIPTIAPASAGVTLVFVSFALILMARGLRRGLRVAWTAAVALLIASVGIHVLHENVTLSTIPPIAAAVWLGTRRACFPVAQSRRAIRRAVAITAVGVTSALAISACLAVAFDQGGMAATGSAALRLGGMSTLPLGYGGRFATPALIAIGLCVLITSLWSLLSPRLSTPSTGHVRASAELRARGIVAAHGGDTLAYFALRDDKQWFFHGASMVAYAVKNGVCVVSPDPIGPVERRGEVWAAFTSFAEAHGWTVSVLGASADWLPVYEASGLHPVYLGDEAIIDCHEFRMDGRAMRSVRQAHSRVRRAGYSVTLVDPALITPALRDQLGSITTLCRRGSFERGFSMTLSRLFDPRDAGLITSIATDADGTPQAFIQWVPCEGGWSLDVTRRNTDPALTNGIIEYLIIESVQAFRAQGFARVGLNFAVFRTVVSGENTAWFGRTVRRVIQGAASQTQIESLWRFNAKFVPHWSPRYAVLGSADAMAAQSIVMAGAEGLTELPVVGRFMTGMGPC